VKIKKTIKKKRYNEGGQVYNKKDIDICNFLFLKSPNNARRERSDIAFPRGEPSVVLASDNPLKS